MAKQGEHQVRGTTCIRENSRTRGCSSTPCPGNGGRPSRPTAVQPEAPRRLGRRVTGAYTCRALSWHPLTAYCFPSSLFSYGRSILYLRKKVKKVLQKQGDGSRLPVFCSFHYRLLERIQMPCFSALAISSSRKIGCAMLISFSARSQVEQPTRLTPPYSVTM